MAKFNLKIAAKEDSVMPMSKRLDEYNKDRNFTLEEGNPSYNGILSDSRNNKDLDMTSEGRINNIKESSSTPGTTEFNLSKSDSWFPHRKYKKEGSDNFDVTLINQTSESFDSRFREDFKKANKTTDKDTEFWDKYVGDQNLTGITKIVTNVQEGNRQLVNDPSRFTSDSGLPTEVDFRKNDINSVPTTKSLVFASKNLKNLDDQIFQVYFKVASENRELNEQEITKIAQINQQKASILSNPMPLNPTTPSKNNPQVPAVNGVQDALNLQPDLDQQVSNLIPNPQNLSVNNTQKMVGPNYETPTEPLYDDIPDFDNPIPSLGHHSGGEHQVEEHPDF